MGTQTRTRMTAWRCGGALFVVALLGVVIVCPTSALAQRSTEQFIPIGQSPGLSGMVTYAGEIAEIDPGRRTITLRRPADVDRVTVTVAPDTQIWLDRSSVGRPSLPGRFTDLVSGSVVEIHFQDAERRQIADWIKLESDRPD